VRPGFESLIIDPDVPASLGEIRITRHFRGGQYRITSRHAKAGEAKGLTVNGQPTATREIAPQPGGTLEILATA
jgi:cellobiose phosphorylase